MSVVDEPKKIFSGTARVLEVGAVYFTNPTQKERRFLRLTSSYEGALILAEINRQKSNHNGSSFWVEKRLAIQFEGNPDIHLIESTYTTPNTGEEKEEREMLRKMFLDNMSEAAKIVLGLTD